MKKTSRQTIVHMTQHRKLNRVQTAAILFTYFKNCFTLKKYIYTVLS